ncbi:MAG: alpha/beta hydrolase [Chloroflexota bacterium]
MTNPNSDLLNFIHIPAVEGADTDTDKDKIDNLFTQLDDRGVDNLVLYFHGGLTPRAVAESSAKLMFNKFGTATRHTISPIWETGGGETLQSIISKHVDLPIVNRLIKWVRSKADTRQETESAVLSPEVENAESTESWLEPLSEAELDFIEAELVKEFQADLDQDLDFQTEVSMASEETIQNHFNELNNDITLEMEPIDDSEGTLEFGALLDLPRLPFRLAGVTRRVIGRERSGRGHGSKATIIEELVREFSAGAVKSLWDDMKKRAQTMWHMPTRGEFKPAEYFLFKLAELKKKKPDLAIDLIGHSAGSIVIAHFLAAADFEHELTFRNVIFLAPAATMDLFHDEIVTYPQRFQRFRMFTMNDMREQEDNIEFNNIEIYNRSLLYFVAGVLETEVDQPLSGMHRYMTSQEPFNDYKLKRINRFLNENDRLALAGEPTGGGGETDATTHGGYYAEAKTLATMADMFNA